MNDEILKNFGFQLEAKVHLSLVNAIKLTFDYYADLNE